MNNLLQLGAQAPAEHEVLKLLSLVKGSLPWSHEALNTKSQLCEAFNALNP